MGQENVKRLANLSRSVPINILCLRLYIYIYIYIYTHTHTHIYIKICNLYNMSFLCEVHFHTVHGSISLAVHLCEWICGTVHALVL